MSRLNFYDSLAVGTESCSGSTSLPVAAGRAAGSPLARFEAKIEKTDTCWLWAASCRPNGYGQFWDGERLVSAHRFSYEAYVGPIPEGLTIDHLCRVRRCVNPAHLEAVTRAENARRSDSPPALNARKIHCVHGHEFTEENTYVASDGSRSCRACLQSDERKFYSQQAWRRTRKEIVARDGRCVLGFLFGGDCVEQFEVHHIVPLSEGGDPLDPANLVTVCKRHHATIAALRRAVLREIEQGPPSPRRCRHRHTNAAGREACERRLNAAVA